MLVVDSSFFTDHDNAASMLPLNGGTGSHGHANGSILLGQQYMYITAHLILLQLRQAGCLQGLQAADEY
jgi:hypothetical protein